MIKTTTQILIERLKSGESIICNKCKKGIIIYEMPEGHVSPEIYCNNPECRARIIFN